MSCEHEIGPWPGGSQKWPACLKCEIEKLIKERDKFRNVLLICSTESEKQLRQELSLAEEGLANYAQENAQLREALLRLSVSAQRVSEEAALALARGAK